MRYVWCHDGQRVIYSNVLSMGVCAHARMCATFDTQIVLMHFNVMILSAVRSRPLVQVSFHVHYFASYLDITVFENQHQARKIARLIV